MRNIQSIHKSQKVNMGGIILDQPLPVGDLKSVGPFLLIHHWSEVLPGGQRQKDVGVGAHPHRGFSPVSVVYKGAIHHRDSMGSDSVVAAGGTQWMMAGKGITHSERPSAELAEAGGAFEFIQFWVNLPAAHKMDVARYIPLQSDETPKYSAAGVEVSVISGSFKDIQGAIQTPHEVVVASLDMKKGSRIEFDVPMEDNGLLYQLDGTLSIQGQHDTFAKTLYELGDGEDGRLVIVAKEDSRILLLHGRPLNEAVTHYGPFVMNTQTEIMQALRDSQMGKMGVLIED